MTLEEKEKSIIEHYGLNPQLKYIQTEVFEMNEAIIRHEENAYPSDMCLENIIEEIADVQMMLNQFKVYFNIKEEELNKIMNFKADRQLKRIEQEKGR